MTPATSTPSSIRIGPVSAIPIGEGRAYRIGKLSIAIYRPRTGDLYATQADCPHRNGPLADGLIGEGRVICPLHGYTFSLATGEPVGTQCAALRTYPVSIDAAGDIVVVIDPVVTREYRRVLDG
jgi:nitrite reductase (NADH) small subunit